MTVRATIVRFVLSLPGLRPLAEAQDHRAATRDGWTFGQDDWHDMILTGAVNVDGDLIHPGYAYTQAEMEAISPRHLRRIKRRYRVAGGLARVLSKRSKILLYVDMGRGNTIDPDNVFGR